MKNDLQHERTAARQGQICIHKFMEISKLAFIAILALVVVSSCSKIPKEKVIHVSSAEISGNQGTFFKVVPGDYTLEYDGNSVSIAVKVQLNEVDYSYKGNDFETPYLKITDKSGAEIGEKFSSEAQPLKDLMQSAQVGKIVTLTFKAEWLSDKDVIKKLMKEGEGLKLTEINYKEVQNYGNSSSYNEENSGNDENSDASMSESSSSGSVDYDEYLDQYDQFVTKYISMLKKAKHGDATAAAEYADLLQQAQDMGEKLENAQGELSAEQIARYQKILTRLSKAAASL